MARGAGRLRNAPLTAPDPFGAWLVGEPVGDDRDEDGDGGDDGYLLPVGHCRSEHEERERHRRDALGAEPGHESLAGRVDLGPGQRDEDGDGAGHQEGEHGDRRGRPAVFEEGAEVKIAPKTRKTPSFTTSTTSSDRSSNASAMSGLQMPNAMAVTNTATKPLPSGGSVAIP